VAPTSIEEVDSSSAASAMGDRRARLERPVLANARKTRREKRGVTQSRSHEEDARVTQSRKTLLRNKPQGMKHGVTQSTYNLKVSTLF
jgi:hypothetical protein